MISFKRLRRGVKLLIEHIYSPISTVLAKLTSTGVTQDILEKGSGSFRVNIYFPAITSRHASSSIAGGSSSAVLSSVPFVLPPLQEFTDDALGINTETRPDIILEEVSLSSDTRCEEYPLYDYFRDTDPAGPVQSKEGNFDLVDSENHGYTLIIYSKELTGPDSAGTPYQDIVYQMEVNGAALANSTLRLNPYVQSGINIRLDSNKSYMAQIQQKRELDVGNNRVGLFSVLASIKCRHRLVERDKANTQNIPSHNGAFAPVSVSASLPAGNTVITASGATGVDTNLKKVDDLIQKKLKGGYNFLSERNHAENFLNDATYEVIAVNLFSGFWFVRGGSAPSAANFDILSIGSLPYLASDTDTSETIDRRIIPLHYPMTIHHVFAVANYSASCSATAPRPSIRPTSATFTNEVGVGLMSGIRSDLFAYTQVAGRSWTPTNLAAASNTYKIDSASENPGSGYQWDIINIPLVGAGGKSYKTGAAQGYPVFAGRTNSHYRTRSAIPTGGAAGPTLGREQAIEVRWSFKDTGANGMSDTGRYSTNTETVLGLGGHWVFIYGKKHLV